MATPASKRKRNHMIEESSDSEEDSLSFSSDSSDSGSEVCNDVGSSSTMEISDGSNDPTIFISKDGTRWSETFPDDVSKDYFAPKIIDHVPKCSLNSQNQESLTGNLIKYF